MNPQKHQLTLLNDCLLKLQNEPCSFSYLSDVELKFVSQQLELLIADGVLEATEEPNPVYSFVGNVEFLDASTIQSAIERFDCTTHFDVTVHSAISSTNDYLLEQANEPNITYVCVAETQTVGRGRRGNKWRSNPYQNIAMSLSMRFATWPSTASAAALVVAVATASVLNERFSDSVRIKWPNDLMIDGAKLGGILVEAEGVFGGECQIVAGLGLNINQADCSLEEQSGYKWASLSEHHDSIDRNNLIAVLSFAISNSLDIFAKQGFEPFVHAWNELSCYHGQQVKAEMHSGAIIGTQVGVDDTGALLIRDTSKVLHRITDVTERVRPFNVND